jgi:hypothetical protein
MAWLKLLHAQLGQMYSVPDLGDPLFSMWRVGWVTHQIVRDPAHLFDANIFHPEPLTLTLSDPMILPALMSAPLLGLGVHPVVAYNLVFLSAFWLSGLAAYLLVERLTGSARAAFIAGLTYACASFRFDHYSHLEIQMTYWTPLGLLALHLFISTGRWAYAIACGLQRWRNCIRRAFRGVLPLWDRRRRGLLIPSPGDSAAGPPLVPMVLDRHLTSLHAFPAQPAKGSAVQ